MGTTTRPGLPEALLEEGFTAHEPESIMVGESLALAIDVPLPHGVTLRRVTEERDVRAVSAMQDEVFGDPVSADMAEALLRRLSLDDGMELWIAEVGAQIVSAGRLEPVQATSFAGIWGGATRKEWRGHGIYRALTAARARSALNLGKTLIHSDSTEHSRPILERRTRQGLDDNALPLATVGDPGDAAGPSRGRGCSGSGPGTWRVDMVDH